ncbi:hypothetical protein ACLK1X_15685 [Escherichia coli]
MSRAAQQRRAGTAPGGGCKRGGNSSAALDQAYWRAWAMPRSRHYADAGQPGIHVTTDPMAVVDWINMFALAVNERERCWRTRGDCAD